jgi:serine/threonine protein kinase/Leucine-rich repeat (LRR) protein
MMEPLAHQPQKEVESSEATSQDDLKSLVSQLRARDSRRKTVAVRLCDPEASREVAVDWTGIAAALCSASNASDDGPSPIQGICIDLSNASTESSRSWQAAMLPAIASLRDSLVNITLTHCNVTPTTCGNLLNALDPARIEKLVLANNPLGPRGAKVLAAFLRDASALQVLNAANCSLGHFGAQALGGSLPSTLERLDVSHNNMGHDGIWKFADAGLTKRLAGLVELNVSNNQIGDDGCLEIANRLMWLPKLEVLNLSHSDIGSVGMEGLAHSLMDLATPSPPHSNSGDLPACYDSFDSHDGVSHAAGTTGRIRDLCLSNNRLDNSSAQHLGAALTKLGNLRRLDLSRNSIGDDGAQALIDGLLVIPDRDLQVLDLSHNQISDLGAGAFVEHLESLRNLQSLLLSGNSISDARTRIVEMLLKHRQSNSSRAATRSKSHLNGAARRDESASEAGALGNEGDEADISTGDGSRSDDDDLDEEQLALGREHLSELLVSHHEEERSGDGAILPLDRTQLLLMHQRNNLPLSYLKFLSNSFDKHRVLNGGVFGILYSASDDHFNDQGEGDLEVDHEHSITLALRELEIGPAGPLKAVRDAVLEELVCERQNLQLAGFIPALAVTIAPSAIYVLYDTTQKLSLRQILTDPLRRKSLDLRTRVYILKQSAHALRCLHTGEVTPGRRVMNPSFHGDVQPSNIYVSVRDASDDGSVTVHLTDALMSRLVATDRRRFRLGDAVFGSRSYRCPRYERGSAHYDSSSDVFSFGVVMAELLSGRLQRSPLTADSKDRGPSKGQGGLQFYDVYYDVVISRKPFAFDPLRDERSAAKANPPTERYLQMLVQVMGSCMNASVNHRPTASTLAKILEHENPSE